MLDTATKRRIDTARDILVGKVPDPKSQVEQITIALIYKFMDDMDAEAEELGGRRTFFSGEFARYGWAKLMRSGLGGHEMLGLYADAIARMPQNPGVPPLFRDIFKNAYLPYRDPETLRAFLKIIDDFEYDHSERLGDAFEYLLSVLGSQGDAGQFRTPRHIIDFIVALVDPKKDDVILDPACGTAGFLISAWKHIRAANRDGAGESTLTPDEQERLAANIRGYDISPDMVRLSLANMYLHGFTDPHIAEYDTLTSDDRWNEFADVILANPPFMTPKGGIRPHNRFSIAASRSEVLFVDYIAEHLTPTGRAGIIVPEGVIFQSGKAYKALRKTLVEKYLVAVVSLPAGVFQPYSGVKTSVLVLDPAAARARGTVGFFKVGNDGFSLGSQRRKVAGGELAGVLAEIAAYRAGDGEGWEGAHGRAVAKGEIGAGAEYGLNGERYRVGVVDSSTVETAPISQLLALDFGERITKRDDEGTLFPVYGGGGPSFRTDRSNRRDCTVISRFAMSPECVRRVAGEFFLLDSGFTYHVLETASERLATEYADLLLHSMQSAIYACARGHAQKNIDFQQFKNLLLPLPSLDMQREIVAEIEGYQRVIDGARLVLEGYRSHVVVDPAWPIVPLGVLASELKSGFASGEGKVSNEGLPHIRPMNITVDGLFTINGVKRLPASEFIGSKDRSLLAGDVLFNNTNSKELVGKTCMIEEDVAGGFSNHMTRIRVHPNRVLPRYLSTALHNAWREGHFSRMANKWIGQAGISLKALAEVTIALPPLDVQRAIVAELEAERVLVDGNRELIARMQARIDAAVARVWGAAAAPDAPLALAAE